MELGTIWAKRLGKNHVKSYHPLLCHMIDVAEVARAILADVISPAEKRWLSKGFDIGEGSAVRWITVFAGLHDLGKACYGFQQQIPGNSRDVPHGTVSACILRKSLEGTPFDLDPRSAKQLAVVIGGHHGVIPSTAAVTEVEQKTREREWRTIWPELTSRFLDFFPLPESRPSKIDNARAIWLAGFIAAADWVGSNTMFFHYAAPNGTLPADFDFERYRLEIAKPMAHKALHDLGWFATPATTQALSFTRLFPTIERPNDLQECTIRISDKLTEPGLVIIEAPMGEGKTEAALYLADQAALRWDMRGAYVALPTMATSNQMFGRVRDLLGHRYADEFVQVQLLHGHAGLSSDLLALQRNFSEYLSFAERIGCVYGDADVMARSLEEREQTEMASAVASTWFTGRKQGLLSPFGVGTIDQLLLAVLPVKHFFVRLFGLSNKTVILDEVHAYDAYMTTLMERLIGWLAAMGCHVILLSATLPTDKRARLLAAYQARGRGGDEKIGEAAGCFLGTAYPCVTWVSGNESGSTPFAVSPRGRKNLAIRWLSPEIDTLVADLDRALADGGCAAVICNTVRRAQEVFLALRESGRFAANELDLFHARFLLKDRLTREERCLCRFGKPNPDGTNAAERPPRMVLVATQVIEQSLDLDFDLMVSDLAPVDLLLQRAGRLHRHERAHRPASLEKPMLWIIGPDMAEGVPTFERGGEYIYSEHILLRTWWELKDRPMIDVPDDVAALIEAVYDNRDPPEELRARWEETANRVSKEETIETGIAEQWRIR